jgi:hypothetical protein
MPSDDLQHHLNALTRLAANNGEGDAFRITGGALKGFTAATPENLAHARAAIALHRAAHRADVKPPSRQTFGIEIGAGVAKFFAKAWTQGAPGQTIVDVKLRLGPRVGTPETDRTYREKIEEILNAFNLTQPPKVGASSDRLIPPQNIDLSAPHKLREGMPPDADVIYVYGTQGPRASTRQSGPLFPAVLRVLTGDEEALLMFDAIVPQDARTPGAMAIEIGNGSTELALIAAGGRKHAVTFVLGEAQHEGLTTIARAIASGDIAPATRHLESDPVSAAAFLVEARRPTLRLFISANKQSADMRSIARPAPGAPIPVAAVDRYAREHAPAPKPTILATLAHAFTCTTIHEGKQGGLKEAMAGFIGHALAR